MIGRRGVLAGVAALPLAACAPRSDRLRFWAMGNEAAAVGRVLGDLTVDVQALPWSAAHEKLLTGFAGGSLPDVAQVGNTWLAELAAIGALAPLPAGAGLTRDQFAAVLDTNVIGGRLVGVPWYVDTRLQFVRTDLWGEPPPVAWEPWRTALATLRRRTGEAAILLPVNEFEQLLTFGLQTGDPLLRDRDTRGNFRSAGFRAALDFYVSLFRERLAPVIAATEIANIWAEFARGSFATFVSGPWTVGDLTSRVPALKGRWTTAGMPGPDGPGASAPGGSSLVVFTGTRDPAAAWALVRRLADPAVQVRFHAVSGDLPARPSAWEPAGLTRDPLLAPFGPQLERARAVPKVPEWERIVTEMQRVAETAVRGQRSVAAACAEIDARADRLLAKRRWMLERAA